MHVLKKIFCFAESSTNIFALPLKQNLQLLCGKCSIDDRIHIQLGGCDLACMSELVREHTKTMGCECNPVSCCKWTLNFNGSGKSQDAVSRSGWYTCRHSCGLSKHLKHKTENHFTWSSYTVVKVPHASVSQWISPVWIICVVLVDPTSQTEWWQDTTQSILSVNF